MSASRSAMQCHTKPKETLFPLSGTRETMREASSAWTLSTGSGEMKRKTKWRKIRTNRETSTGDTVDDGEVPEPAGDVESACGD